MKAIIMAGGEGTRLRPLTCDCPKPMVRMMNRPVMEYAVELLKSHGITDIAVTLGYLPDAVTDYFSDGEDFGVSFKYYIERSPMGTAGGVGKARAHLDETFIVLSGDGLTDLDITDAVRFHREKKALATIILKKVDNPFEYGVVMTGNSGQVTGFIEKPDPGNAFSLQVNTGIYILEPDIFRFIPEDRPYDFGSELFPRLVKAGEAVFGFVSEDYWCDIGDIDAYILAHVHAMDGLIHLPGLRDAISPYAQIHPTAVIEKPCLISDDAVIGENARIGPYSVIGPRCIIEKNAGVKRSILWNDVRIDAAAQTRGCVLGSKSRVCSGAQVYESAVLGPEAELGERASVMPGVKLWPGKHASSGERVEANRIWGCGRSRYFSEGCLPISHPSQAMLAAQAYVSVFTPGMLLLARSDHPIANVMWHAAAAGAMTQGFQVMDCGVCPLPVLRHAMRALGCDGAALVTDDRFIPLQPTGAYLCARQKRAMLTLYARQDFPMPFANQPLSIVSAGAPALSYIARASEQFTADSSNAPGILLSGADENLTALALSVFRRAGLNARCADGKNTMSGRNELGIHISPSGEGFNLSDHTGPLSETQQQLFAAWTALDMGEERLQLPISATRTVHALAEPAGIPVEYTGGEPEAWQSLLAERYPRQFMLHFDGIQAALAGIAALSRRSLSLADWRSLMPDACRQKRRIPISAAVAGQILESFARNMPDSSPDCGVRFSRSGGWAWICPAEDLSFIRVIAESAKAETARELCDFCEKEIKRLSGK
ncbi:MAG: NTP transferase domain-containing protein [Clostridia bacterium]|nr:NTP transferase domain-containing protein [Clostridia bacterium]